jgi:hypothetical protein
MANEADDFIRTLRATHPDLTAAEEQMARERYPNVIFRREPKAAAAEGVPQWLVLAHGMEIAAALHAIKKSQDHRARIAAARYLLEGLSMDVTYV